jgi:hypothetical protein
MTMGIEQWAKINNLTAAEFKRQIFQMAATIGVMELDKKGADIDTTLRFSTSDNLGVIELYIRRTSAKQVTEE